MAEIAIPIALLGGMYILSNQENKNTETFQANRNTPQSRQTQVLNQGTNKPIQNYPVVGTIGKSELKSSPNYYPSPNAATDRYYQQSVYEQQAEQDNTTYKSLTGNVVKKGDLKHNNMVPFFGSKVRQNMNHIVNESALDNMNGSGSQYIKKQEMAPLFKPEDNMQWAHGTPNTSSFIQSRMNPSTKMANVKPFQEIRVGPGLNQKDGVLGSGGFNSGMEARERWMAKTVDELRVKTNPKVTYGGVILGGKNPVTNRGIMGKMEKHQPDTYYINTPERYFTTTGLEKGQTARSIQVLPEENRETTTQSYYGNSGQADTQATYVPSQYKPANRPQLDPYVKHITNAHAADRNDPNAGDHGIQGFRSSVLPNNRDITTNRPPEYGAVSTFAKAVVAPLMDFLRPSRKENVIGNLRPTGNAGNAANHAGYVYNPADRTRTTIREMTENRPDHMFVNNQREAGGYGYTTNEYQPTSQERDSTNIKYMGGAGNTTATNNSMTYDSAYNAHLINKEPISRGRNPMGSSVKMFNGQSHTNIKVDKLETDRLNNRLYVPQQMTRSSATKQHFGQMTARSEYGQDIQCQRMAPETLNAFRNNPYTKSLSSVA
jgi:hypothetical protein